MLQLRQFGGLGSELGQYCFGRLLAERFGYLMVAAPIPGFSNTFRNIEGERFFAPNLEISGQWPRDANTGRNLEPIELSLAPASVVTVNGWFQRFEFYLDIRDTIQNDWLAMENAPVPRGTSDFAICLPTRKLNAFDSGSTITEEEVRRLSQLHHKYRLHFVVDDEQHPLLETLRDLKPEILVAQGLQQFLIIHSFQKVAIAQDSLSWWAAFLGCAREIYFPQCNRGIWSHPEIPNPGQAPWWHGIDLRVYDDPRYIYEW